jgi:AcrR family transcriptional regulator
MARGQVGARTAVDSASTSAATRSEIFTAAEQLFARHGFHAVSIRDITAEAGVNIAAVNYHFGSKDELLLQIFRTRAAELNRERARMLHEAKARHGGAGTLREILAALFTPPIRWYHAKDGRRLALQFILRVRTEGTEAMLEHLHKDISHLDRFAAALKAALPALPDELVYWRLHFCLGLVHNNRPAEFDRLHRLSRGATRGGDSEAMLERMLDFAVAGFGTGSCGT